MASLVEQVGTGNSDYSPRLKMILFLRFLILEEHEYSR